MSITLNRGLATEYSFPQDRFSLDQLPWMRRFSESERAYQHGSVVTSDDKIKSRPGRIWGTISYSTRLAFRTALEQLRAACYIDDPTLHADEFWPDRYIIIKVRNVDGEYYPSLMSGTVEVIFQATDPFWYSDTLYVDNQTILVSPYTFTLTYDGLIETPPLIIYTSGGAQIRLRMLNAGDGSREWIYTENLNLNDKLEVDIAEGTVKRNGTSRMHKWRGTWWNLMPGSNQIRVGITGAVGSSALQIDYRKRWL